MARGYCPVCQRLVGLGPTGERIGSWGSARWWIVDLHARDGRICDGSGKRV